MDPSVADRVARAQAARVRVVDLHARQGPVARFVLTAIGIVIFLFVILLILLMIPVLIVAGLIAAVFFTARRKLAAVGRPNSRVAGVRTDGRDNVRVVTRD